MTTHNGFSKTELLKDIEVNMTRKAYEKTCCQMAELCCSHNGITSYISYLCDYYGKHCLHGNMWLAKRLVGGIQEITALSKRKITHDNGFQRRICELTMLLAVTPIKHHSKLNNPKYAGYLNIVEPLMYQESTMKYRRVIEDAFENILTAEIRKMFVVLYYLVKTDSRKELVVLLNYLTTEGLEGVVQVPTRLPEGVKPANAGDMVWPLWHLVFEFPVNTEIREYLEHLWFLYGYSYNTRSRHARMNILFIAYMAVMRPEKLENKAVKDPLINIACSKIRVAFGDALKIDFEGEDRSKKEKEEGLARKLAAATAKKTAKANASANANAPNTKDNDSSKTSQSKGSMEYISTDPLKYEYLKYYTYFPDTKPV